MCCIDIYRQNSTLSCFLLSLFIHGLILYTFKPLFPPILPTQIDCSALPSLPISQDLIVHSQKALAIIECVALSTYNIRGVYFWQNTGIILYVCLSFSHFASLFVSFSADYCSLRVPVSIIGRHGDCTVYSCLYNKNKCITSHAQK